MELFYRHFGEGQPVIILHGLFGQSDNWVTLGRRLAEKYSVYIPDLRNHGQSPHAPVHSYQAMADDLQEFIEKHGIQNPVIIGHSMGGKAAMTYTLENPEKVAKLVVVDISPRRYPERKTHTEVVTQMMKMDLENMHSRSEAEKLLQVADERVRMFIMKNLYYKMPGKLGWRLNLQAINDNMDELFDKVGIPSVYEGPTLFIRGGKSDYVPDEDFALIHKFFPEAYIKTIPEATHWLHADAPGKLCAMLSGFLGRECLF